MSGILIETDIGQDPDDLFALLYLLSTGVEIRGIVLSPGDAFQVAITKFLLQECGREDIPVGVSSRTGDLQRKTRFHYSILDKYGYPHNAKADGYGPDIMREVRDKYPAVEFFLIGPLFNMKEYLESDGYQPILHTVMQGGFVPYNILQSNDYVPVDRFQGKTSFMTFNLCSYREGGQLLFDAQMDKSFVTKNLCNTLWYDRNLADRILPQNRAMALFKECSSVLFSGKKKKKKLHDVYAAVNLLHPDIFEGVCGKMYYTDDGKCSARLEDSGDVLELKVDEDKMWDYITRGV
jgi:inosine-uridine nucleoside N-ribohydrolase